MKIFLNDKIWKTILNDITYKMEVIDYPNYLIYDDGRVYSKYKNIFLKPGLDKGKYHLVSLSNYGKKTHKVHRLVALHYIPNPENKPCVDHIDRNRTNNHISNLRWVTHLENNQNVGMSINNTSGIKNIHYDNCFNRWTYKKEKFGKIHQKCFKTFEEAVEYKKEYELKLC